MLREYLKLYLAVSPNSDYRCGPYLFTKASGISKMEEEGMYSRLISKALESSNLDYKGVSV